MLAVHELIDKASAPITLVRYGVVMNGEIKTRVFYCDPYSSWQKGMIEKNHEFIRYIIPSGKSFDNLSQQDITLMMTAVISGH